jgi:hypothetical protein
MNRTENENMLRKAQLSQLREDGTYPGFEEAINNANRLSREEVRFAVIIVFGTIAGYAVAVAAAMWSAGLLHG